MSRGKLKYGKPNAIAFIVYYLSNYGRVEKKFLMDTLEIERKQMHKYISDAKNFYQDFELNLAIKSKGEYYVLDEI